MDLKATFTEVLCATPDLPADLRDHAHAATGLEIHASAASYLAFLGEQIRATARGPAWTARLRRRRAALSPFLGVPLLRGEVAAGTVRFTVEINPAIPAVVHWEAYEKSE